jgi:hypothetical protein
MAVPGKIENKMNGQSAGTIVVDTVVINTILPDSLFQKPAKKL